MTASPQQWDAQSLGQRIDALLDEAQGLIDRLRVVSDHQQGAVESGDVARIVEVVSQREPLVSSIVRVGEEIGAFIENRELMALVPEPSRSEALRRISGFEHAMKLLRERDARDQRLMEQARDRLAGQLSGMSHGKSALRAYSTRARTPDPIMQDRRG